MTTLLRVHDLRTWIPTAGDPVRAVDGVSLGIEKGEVLGIVGESGSGKSVLARSVMGLLPRGAVTAGSVELDGRNLLDCPEHFLGTVRGKRIAMVFQDAGRALNPVVRIGRQMRECMTRHLGISRREADERAVTLLAEVGVPAPRTRLAAYPHELSGGMRQRVMIAMALSCEPDLLIADEPTTALDVTVQRQILDLLARVRTTHGMALLLISHDLGLVAGRTDRVAVMYAGRVVETGPTAEVFAAPRHRYTRALLASTPTLDLDRSRRMQGIEGSVPDPRRHPPGCRFAPRCGAATPECSVPGADDLPPAETGHVHACLHPEPAAAVAYAVGT